MSKEHFWFLIFVLAAAVVTGSTLGMFTNFKFISAPIKLHTKEVNTTDVQSKKANENVTPAQTTPQPVIKDNNSADKQESVNSTPAATKTTAENSNPLQIGQNDMKQIDSMLATVDNTANGNTRTKVEQFQGKNSLPKTGVIDAQTLALIINQAKLQKTVQRLSN